jgi:hypothetical protein
MWGIFRQLFSAICKISSRLEALPKPGKSRLPDALQEQPVQTIEGICISANEGVDSSAAFQRIQPSDELLNVHRVVLFGAARCEGLLEIG